MPPYNHNREDGPITPCEVCAQMVLDENAQLAAAASQWRDAVRELGLRTPDVEVVQVIRVKFVRGSGLDGDIKRLVVAIYTPAGELLSEHDPAKRPA